MDPLTIGLIGLGLGLGKNALIDKPREKQDRLMRAAEIRYSPWTKLQQLTQVREADPFGSALQFGLTGATFGQGLENQKFQDKFNEQLLQNMQRGATPNIMMSPWGLSSNSFWNRPSY